MTGRCLRSADPVKSSATFRLLLHEPLINLGERRQTDLELFELEETNAVSVTWYRISQQLSVFNNFSFFHEP